MAQERYLIFYSSRTGNTKMLADAIREALPEDACDAFGTNDTAGPLSELLYVGFWTDRGNADSDALALLARLRKKKILLSHQDAANRFFVRTGAALTKCQSTG